MAKTPVNSWLLLLPTLLILFFCSFFSHQDQYVHHINTIDHPPYRDISSFFTKILMKEKEKMKKKSDMEKIEDGLARARAAIREAARIQNCNNNKSMEEKTFVPRGPVYRNPCAFQQSHAEMLKRFKIWTYKEGERPLVHQGPMMSIYGIEGQFIQEMEEEMSSIVNFMASHPKEAHVFFLPFSVVNIRMAIYKPLNYDTEPVRKLALDYLNVVAHKYPYFNTSLGADHFMLSCHDWAPMITLKDPFKNVIRALCNANTSEGFQPTRDVPIPEVNVPATQLNQPSLGVQPSKRSIFAFFAGGNHGHVRKFLFEHWAKDGEVQLFEHLPKNQDYFQTLGQSKFCLCPSGYEVATSRFVEAILAECVPVLIKDNYSFPFSDVLDWSRFSIYVPVAKIPQLKMILKGISSEKYEELVQGTRDVKWHFTFNRPAKPYDLIHMVLHSIWLRRLNIRLQY